MANDPTAETISQSVRKQLIVAARDAARFAYVPYSNFPVGAAVLTASGEIVSGVNIENASIGLTCCGERTAIFKAASAGHREIRAVAVSAPRAPGTSPCGACRQVINEFRPPDGDVLVLLDEGEQWREVSLSTLLPMAFGPHDLERAT